MARGFDFGKFAEVLGGHGVQFGQQLTQREKAAPMDKLREDLLRKQLKQIDLNLDKSKDEKAAKRNLENKKKNLIKLLQDPEIVKTITEQAREQMGDKAGPPVPETTQRQPTLGEQVQRLRGTEFEFPSDPAIQKQVEGLRGRFAAQQQPMLEQEEFDREQAGKIELQELKGEQRSKEKQLDRDFELANNPEEAIQDVRAKGEERRMMQFHQNQLTNHVKNTKAFIRTGFLVKNIDNALRETGAGGIFGEGDIKSVGFGSKSYRKWLNSEEAVKVRQAVSMFFLGKIKEQSGVAVSDKEFERIESAFGLNNRSTMNAFRESMKIAADETKTQLSQFEKALSPIAKGLLKERELLTSDQLPGSDQTAQGEDLDLQEDIQIQSDEEYDELPSGTVFIDPEGRRRVKP